MAFKILLANTRGFCAGVERAIGVVQRALEKFGAERVYVLHEVVHNKHVVADLVSKGAHLVEELSEIPEPSTKVVIFSAHGVGLDTIEQAQKLGLTVIDATCPLVKRIHTKVVKAAQNNMEVVIIGHDGHREVLGTLGQYAGPKDKVHVILTPEDVANLSLPLGAHQAMFATQTTLSIDETAKTVAALKAKFPLIEGPKNDDTCYATQHRQAAVKLLAQECQLVLIAGSQNSSNSRRLSEVAQQYGATSYLIDDASAITDDMLQGVTAVGVSAGASVPEYIVQDILTTLKNKGATQIEPVGEIQRHITFAWPQGLE